MINRTIFFVAALFLLAFQGYSQIKLGAKFNVGTSWISSSNLKDNFEYQMNNDIEITQWDVNYKPGIMIGLGVVASYELSSNLSLNGELSYNYQQSNINIDFADIESTVVSEAKIRSSRIAIPVTLHYSLGSEKPSIHAGFEWNIFGTPEIESNETEFIGSAAVDQEGIIGELDSFTKSRLNFLLGVGKTIDLGGSNFDLHIRYHLPLTGSSMYNTTSPALFDDNTMNNNEVFGVLGASDAAQEAPQYPLDNFKMHFIDLSISYFFN
ncbi:outer membrane beta-barrel protein [Mangrovivirga sp. M17]|uniref:Outer membrane beta-barrel protein n=1 Tax=Mangrovivirga halotolerans TaxID=2993936 RepID=A0ABT3RR55_9BACT|nr:outer membrane beta-barrel protein [Mangrovivirga halotolerans]MCX2744105.1 outer membrane beta-barrel protein [Mangrovivirga halotolerans]